MSGIALAFGSYTFPAGWTITKDEDMRTVPMAAIPRRDGEAWQTATRKARKFTLTGGIYLSALPAGCVTVRDGIDQLKKALYSGPRNFQIESDRYFQNAQVDGAPVTHGPAYGSYAEISLNILCPDPYEYEVAATTSAARAIGGVVSDPTAAPVLTATGSGGALSAGTYHVGYTFYNGAGESKVSPSASITITTGQTIVLAAIPRPLGAVGIKIYVSSAVGSTTLALLSLNAYTLDSGSSHGINGLGTGAAVPVSNTTINSYSNTAGNSETLPKWVLAFNPSGALNYYLQIGNLSTGDIGVITIPSGDLAQDFLVIDSLAETATWYPPITPGVFTPGNVDYTRPTDASSFFEGDHPALLSGSNSILIDEGNPQNLLASTIGALNAAYLVYNGRWE
jgi:hypothetical protein